MHCSGLVKRKRKTKNVRKISSEEQTLSSNHAKDSFEIDELWRMCREQSERAPEMRTDELVCAKEERTFSGESAFVSDPDSAKQCVCRERGERLQRSRISELLWNLPRSQSALENSEPQRHV